MATDNDKRERPNFANVKVASLRCIEQVLARWLPGGKRQGKEYVAANPTRADKHAGSFSVNLDTGTWADFASGDKGGDLIDLAAYLDNCSAVDACERLGDFLNLPTSNGAALPNKNKPAQWSPVVPIPEAAMGKCPPKHYRHGKPSKLWIYRDDKARPLMIVYRFDTQDADGAPDKVFAPLTWCKAADGTQQWRWQGLAEPRPLLNLDQLAKRKTAPVVLCEGEKAADAAAELLPHYVATCWPNGSQSTHKADFAPLRGREVLLWPDNDAPGQTCMTAIAERLRELGAASVRVVAMDVFGKMPTLENGNAGFTEGGDWSEGDDAADALAKGWTAAHLDILEKSGELLAPIGAAKKTNASERKSGTKKAAKKPQPDSPRDTATENVPVGFRMTPEGVVFCTDDGERRHVCSPLEILARTRDEKGHNWGLLVEFDDPDGAKKRWNIPARSMAGDFGKEVLAPLVDMGLRLAPGRSGRNARNDLQSYLQGYDSPERARLVNRMGWHGHAYLLPEQQVGDSSEHLHFYEAGAQLPPISQAGSLEGWQEHVGALCVGNNRLAFVVSVAFAGPLLNLIGAESGGFHLYGDSSGGKTTHLQVAASVYGGPRLVRSWRSTDNALESIAAAHSDGLLVLDEIGMCDPRIIGETVYMLGNGTGKARANDRGMAGRAVQEWRLLFLSTGEKTLAQHMAEAHKELKAGMEVRMLAVPADAGQGMGMFEALHGQDDAAALSDSLKAKVGKYYGAPLVAFLHELCKPGQLAGLAFLIRREMDRFTSAVLPPSASGQAQRAAGRFALAAVAGELATGFGVTGWPEGTAWNAARACLAAWLGERGGAGNMEGDSYVATLRLYIQRFGESRFTRWDGIAVKVDEHAPRTTDRLGFRRTVDYGCGDSLYTAATYYVLTEAWRSEIFKGKSIQAVNKVLIERGILQPSSDGKAAKSERLPGMNKTRCYVFEATALFREEDPEVAATAAA